MEKNPFEIENHMENRLKFQMDIYREFFADEHEIEDEKEFMRGFSVWVRENGAKFRTVTHSDVEQRPFDNLLMRYEEAQSEYEKREIVREAYELIEGTEADALLSN